jgi:hypothetical protein
MGLTLGSLRCPYLAIVESHVVLRPMENFRRILSIPASSMLNTSFLFALSTEFITLFSDAAPQRHAGFHCPVLYKVAFRPIGARTPSPSDDLRRLAQWLDLDGLLPSGRRGRAMKVGTRNFANRGRAIRFIKLGEVYTDGCARPDGRGVSRFGPAHWLM